MSWPAVVLWIVVVPAMLSSGPALLYLALVVNVFMSLQMMPGDGGGVNLLPNTVFAAALLAKVLLAPGNLLRGVEAALDLRRMGLYTAFMAFVCMSAVLFPRMFAGLVAVIPLSGASLDGPSLLQPRSGNFNQTGYQLISYLTALAIAVIGSREEVRRHYRRALVVAAVATIVTGLMDFFGSSLGLSTLLGAFRTASYTMLTDAETAGVKRVVGLTPEASAYGGLCMAFASALLFWRPLYRPGRERLIATAAMIGVLLMAVLSTSTTAYLGIAVLGVVYFVDLLSRAISSRALGKETAGGEFALIGLAGLVFVAVSVFASHLLDPAYNMLNDIIFHKSESMSYYQRSMWSQIGWQAFLDTGFMGVGLGSVRTSNWVVSILSSTGIIGGCLIFGFIAQKLLASDRGLDPESACWQRGLKLWIVPNLVMTVLGGTTPDLGLLFAMILGFLSATPPAPQSVVEVSREAPRFVPRKNPILARSAEIPSRP